MRHSSIIIRATGYFLAVLCVGFGKEFHEVGSAKLLVYTWADWLTLAVSQSGECLMTMVAFFDKSFGEHMANGGGTKPPALSKADFAVLMADWKETARP